MSRAPNPSRSPAPLTRSKARFYLLINLLACPGVGTVLGGRRIGYVQTAVMLGGFCLLMVFAYRFIMGSVQAFTDSTWTEAQWRAQTRESAGTGALGLFLCAVAWAWSLISSIGLLRRATPEPPDRSLPPKIRT